MMLLHKFFEFFFYNRLLLNFIISFIYIAIQCIKVNVYIHFSLSDLSLRHSLCIIFYIFIKILNVIQLFLKYFRLFIADLHNLLMCLLFCKDLKLNYYVFLIFTHFKMLKIFLKMMSNVFNTKILNCSLYFDFMKSIVM